MEINMYNDDVDVWMDEICVSVAWTAPKQRKKERKKGKKHAHNHSYEEKQKNHEFR